MSKNITFLVVLIAFFSSLFLQAQTNDSNFVFQSPRPLISGETSTSDFRYSAGGDLLFTESGFGGGIFYDIRINKSISLEFDVSLTYLRASDEFESWEGIVPGKIRRLWRMPITVGIRYEPFGNVLSDNFKPYITAGGGTGIILETPYPYPFFQSLNYLKAYAKPAIYLGFGADFTGKSARTSRVFVKYYFIPYGGEGIESVEGLPITNCGGLFLGINFGGGWK